MGEQEELFGRGETSQERRWSPQQEAVFADAEGGKGHTVVEALAGTGKTTTIIEALARLPRRGRAVLTAFNRSVADELQARVPPGAEVKTLHGLGYGAIIRAMGKVEVDKDKGFDIALEVAGGADRDTARSVERAARLAKCCLADTREAVEDVVDRFDIDNPSGTREELAAMAHAAMALARTRLETIDFDDQVWLPHVMGFRPRPCGRLFVDEVQDMNPAQLELVLGACDGRICAVGDRNQAMYSFTGAEQDSVQKVTDGLGAKVLPLTVTYRCARSIVAFVQDYVPALQAAPGAPEGEVVRANDLQMMKRAAPGDFVLSRTNAPLLGLCLEFLRDGRRAVVAGKDVGLRLLALVKKSRARHADELLAWVELWRAKEAKRLAARNKSPDSVNDTAACIRVLAEGLEEVHEVADRIQRLFADDDDKARIVLSTTHKAKGLERERAWVLARTYLRSPDQEERNLFYVACTRAKTSLFLVGREGSQRRAPTLPGVEWDDEVPADDWRGP